MGICSESILDLAEALLRLECGRSSIMRQSSGGRCGERRVCGSWILCGFVLLGGDGIFLRVRVR